ncbi:hypothetical protein PanWU01x14_357410, partial [Parasponia andersonii]
MSPATFVLTCHACSLVLEEQVVQIVRVRDSNSICVGLKISRCDICDIFVIGRNFEICGGSGWIEPIGLIPKPTTDLIGGAGLCPRDMDL